MGAASDVRGREKSAGEAEPKRVGRLEGAAPVRFLPFSPNFAHSTSRRFVRDSNVDPSTLSWEDMLAEKYYASLFREYALVSLERYKEGAVRPLPPFPSSSILTFFIHRLPSAGVPNPSSSPASVSKPAPPSPASTTNPPPPSSPASISTTSPPPPTRTTLLHSSMPTSPRARCNSGTSRTGRGRALS